MPREMPLRIAFFGLPLAALLLAKDGHSIELCGVCRKDALGVRRAKRVFGERVIVKPKVNEASVQKRVREMKPDLVVSWFWTTRLPMSLIESAKHGGIGVHPSLLPRHRGPDPTTWAILSGDTKTGVTVHRIAAEYDTGAILEQEAIEIDPTWTGWDLAKALDRPSLRALRRTVNRFARGENLEALEQDEHLATLAPLLGDEDAAIHWTWPTERVLRYVRAFAPSPGAWTEIEGKLVVLLEAKPAARFPAALEPGEGFSEAGCAVIRTGDGAIFLVRGEIEGKAASAEDLAGLFLPKAPLLG